MIKSIPIFCTWSWQLSPERISMPTTRELKRSNLWQLSSTTAGNDCFFNRSALLQAPEIRKYQSARSLCRVFLKQMHGLFFCIFVFSTVDIKYEKYMKILLMTGCEPWYHGIGSDSSANWATTIAPINCADLKQICQQGSKDWPAPTSPVPRRKSSSLGSWWHFRKASAT